MCLVPGLTAAQLPMMMQLVKERSLVKAAVTGSNGILQDTAYPNMNLSYCNPHCI